MGLPIVTYCPSQAFHYVLCFINTEHTGMIQIKEHKQNHKKTRMTTEKYFTYQLLLICGPVKTVLSSKFSTLMYFGILLSYLKTWFFAFKISVFFERLVLGYGYYEICMELLILGNKLLM